MVSYGRNVTSWFVFFKLLFKLYVFIEWSLMVLTQYYILVLVLKTVMQVICIYSIVSDGRNAMLHSSLYPLNGYRVRALVLDLPKLIS